MTTNLHLCGPVIHLPQETLRLDSSLCQDTSPSEASWLSVNFHSWIMIYSNLSFAGVFQITLFLVCLFAVTKDTE